MFDSDPIDSLLVEAAARLAAGNYQEALRVAGRALSIDPVNVRALRIAAVACSHLGDHPQAVRLCQAALAVDPTSPDSLTIASECYRRAGLHAEALKTAFEVIRLTPSSPNGHLACVAPYLNVRQRRLALEAAQHALGLRPGDVRCHLAMSAALLANYRLVGAAREARAARRIEPLSSEAAFLLGMSMLYQFRLISSYRALREAVTLDPADKRVQQGLAKVVIGPRRLIIFVMLAPLWGPGLILAVLWPFFFTKTLPAWSVWVLAIAWWTLIVLTVYFLRRRLRIDPILKSIFRDKFTRRRQKRLTAASHKVPDVLPLDTPFDAPPQPDHAHGGMGQEQISTPVNGGNLADRIAERGVRSIAILCGLFGAIVLLGWPLSLQNFLPLWAVLPLMVMWWVIVAICARYLWRRFGHRARPGFEPYPK